MKKLSKKDALLESQKRAKKDKESLETIKAMIRKDYEEGLGSFEIEHKNEEIIFFYANHFSEESGDPTLERIIQSVEGEFWNR